MLLRLSSERDQIAADLNSVTSDDIDSGVRDGPWLRRLTEAAIRGDWLGLAASRPMAEAAMGEQQVADILVVAAAFNGITRVADATGIPLDPDTHASTGEMREDTGIERFNYSEKSARYDGRPSQLAN